MKKRLLQYLLAAAAASCGQAHDHIEIRRDPGNPSRLGIIVTGTNLNQTATYFPRGEAPSFELHAFPGGAYATLLSFSAFDNSPQPPGGALVGVEIVSVSGPAGGAFSFWETGASAPTWTRPVGWTTVETDKPSVLVSESNAGYGHLHGRVFTTSVAGMYEVTFRASDALGNYAASAPFVVRFHAINPPQLAIRQAGTSVMLSFASRSNLSYDVQRSTTLAFEDWTTIGDPLDGTGGALEFIDPIAGRMRAFYRLVEY